MMQPGDHSMFCPSCLTNRAESHGDFHIHKRSGLLVFIVVLLSARDQLTEDDKFSSLALFLPYFVLLYSAKRQEQVHVFVSSKG